MCVCVCLWWGCSRAGMCVWWGCSPGHSQVCVWGGDAHMLACVCVGWGRSCAGVCVCVCGGSAHVLVCVCMVGRLRAGTSVCVCVCVCARAHVSLWWGACVLAWPWRGGRRKGPAREPQGSRRRGSPKERVEVGEESGATAPREPRMDSMLRAAFPALVPTIRRSLSFLRRSPTSLSAAASPALVRGRPDSFHPLRRSS